MGLGERLLEEASQFTMDTSRRGTTTVMGELRRGRDRGVLEPAGKAATVTMRESRGREGSMSTAVVGRGATERREPLAAPAALVPPTERMAAFSAEIAPERMERLRLPPPLLSEEAASLTGVSGANTALPMPAVSLTGEKPHCVMCRSRPAGASAES